MFFGIIEVIRGIACILIVCYHFSSKSVPSGFLGVDQFFIISGFLITYSIHRNTTKCFNVFDFMNKRIKRIIPLKCVTLIYVVLLNRYFVKEKVTDLELDSVTALLFYFNFKLINDDSDYFASNSINLILNFWTLSVEEQYYLYVSIISFMTVIMSNTYTIIFHVVVVALSLALFIFYFYKWYVFSFYSIFTRIWEFSCGSLLYYWDIKPLNKMFMNIVFFVQVIFLFSNIKGFIPFLIINIITYIEISYSKYNEDCIFSNSIIRFVGKISYSVYLLHYSNILIFNWKYSIPIIIGGSVLLYYLIEKPFRNYVPGVVIILLYIVSFGAAYILYKKDYRTVMQRHTTKVFVGDIETYFVKDHCSYDIIDYIYKSKYRVLLLGDSHTLHYIRAFYDNSHKVILYHSYIPDGAIRNKDFSGAKYLSKYTFDMIIIAFWQSGFRNTTYEDQIYLLIKEINGISNKILVISDNPYLSVDPHACLSTPKYCYGIVGVNCSVVKTYSLSSYKYPSNMKVYDYSIEKHIIQGNKCLFQIDDIPVYRDAYHVSSFFVENIVMHEIHALLNKIMNKNIWKDEPITNITYHCLESEHNIYWYVCRKNKYRIPRVHNKPNQKEKILK